MISLIRRIRRHLTQRQDSEYRQAIPEYVNWLRRETPAARDDGGCDEKSLSMRFVAAMSRQIWSSLGGLVTNAQNLAGTSLDAEQRECSRAIDASANTLLSLVAEVRDLSAIRTGLLQRSDADFNVYDLFHSIERMVLPLAAAKGLDFKIKVDSHVACSLRGDSELIRQVVVKLAANAVKFTQSGSVRIHAGVVDTPNCAGKHLRIAVRDTGIGISLAAQARMFRVFDDIDDATTCDDAGTGLGLAIAKALTELLGGTITFKSNPDVGSHFWIDLPYVAANLTVGSAVSTAPRDNVIALGRPRLLRRKRSRQLNLLIADDQATSLMVLRRILGKAGHQVRSVCSGEAVLEAIRNEDFDAILVDLHMPRMSGLEVIHESRSLPKERRSPPIIIVSADSSPDSMLECQDAGAFAYLSKPVAVHRLLEVLAEISGDVDCHARIETASVGDVNVRSIIEQSVLDQLAGIRLGDGFIGMFVQECLRDSGAALVELERCAGSALWPEYRDHCHALKGVAAQMGAVRLATAADWAMQTSQSELPEACASHLLDVRREHELACEALRVPLSMHAA